VTSAWCTVIEQLLSRLKPALNDMRVGRVHVGGIRAFGVDPSFNTRSGLYRSDSFQRRWQFFNSSKSSPEVSTAGVPFAFFPRTAYGYDDGFPVFFPVLVQPASVALLHFLHALQSTLPHELFVEPVHLWHCVRRCKIRVRQ
jgi:hypothetical protein